MRNLRVLVAGLVARRTGRDFDPAWWARLERMIEFAGALSEGGDGLPMLGDADDAYVLDLGDARGDPRPLCAVGAVLFGRPDMKAWAGGYPETALWLLGRGSRAAWDAIPRPEAASLASRAFADSGHYLLQCGSASGAR